MCRVEGLVAGAEEAAGEARAEGRCRVTVGMVGGVIKVFEGRSTERRSKDSVNRFHGVKQCADQVKRRNLVGLRAHVHDFLTVAYLTILLLIEHHMKAKYDIIITRTAY
jgi:hypothetical protein